MTIAAVMAKGRSSLAEQLAELGDVAPKDYDFEEEADDFDASRRRNGVDGGASDGSEGEEDAARSHALHNLVNVGPSELRRKANFIEDVDEDTRRRYQGVKATRKEMLSSDDDDDRESEEDPSFESDEEMDDDEELDSDDEQPNEGDASDSTESDHVSQSPVPKKTLRFADEEETQVARESSADGVGNAVQSDANLLNELRQRSKAEAQRGRDARRQMDAWGRILGSRIRAQKAVRGATRIPTEVINNHVASCTSGERESFDQLLATFDQLSGFLFQLQDRMLRSYASTSDDDTSGVQKSLQSLQARISSSSQKPSSKRKLDDDEFDEHLETAFSLHDRVHAPLWRSVLAKWSWRTSTNAMEDMKKSKSTFDSGNNASNGLKAVNQSAQDQIERGLRGDAYERLRKRTRTWRGNESEARVRPADRPTNADEGNVEDIDVFDDSDFYSALLRELIDSKGAGGDQGENGQLSGAWAQAANRAAKKHRDVDRKASKGRRLRYDVHEKVQNFMPPIPAETWTAEQIARLMQQIRSGSLANADEDTGEEAVTPVELGGLRLFG